jgi:hypothetical protein
LARPRLLARVKIDTAKQAGTPAHKPVPTKPRFAAVAKRDTAEASEKAREMHRLCSRHDTRNRYDQIAKSPPSPDSACPITPFDDKSSRNT